MRYDLVVRNGMIVDGSGALAYRGDLGIVGDTIGTIGTIRDRGLQEIDAEGHIVTPGLIEVHTHMDAQMFWDSLGTCSAWHGITSALFGNCGFTLAPCEESRKDLCLRSLERAEDMARDVLQAGIKWSWETFPEYLATVDKLPKGINYAGLIGHSSLRTWVMGERAFYEAATGDDIKRMGNQIEDALRAGALGFSTSRLDFHRTSDDKPVASRLAEWSEVEQLVDVMRNLGTGIFELANEISHDPVERAAYNNKLAEVAIKSGRPTTFACSSLPFAPDLGQEYLDLANATARRGGRMTCQVLPREFGTTLGFGVYLPFDMLPEWKEMRSLPLEEQRAVLLDPMKRRHLVEAVLVSDYRGMELGAEPKPPNWDTMRVLDFNGHEPTVAEVAVERGVTPVDAVIDLSLDRNFNQFFVQPSANLDREKIYDMLAHPRSVIGLTDTGAHVSQISDTSIPTYFLAHWVREKEAFTWEEGIKMLTADVAALLGLNDRGVLREGMMADIAVIDTSTIGPGPVELARDLPAGGRRLRQKALGVKATVVGGAPLILDGEHTGEYPGRLIRGPLAS